MLLLQQHNFNSVKITLVFGTFKLCIKVTSWFVIVRYFCHMTTTFFQVSKNVFLLMLEICYILVRSNYVRNNDTITLPVGSAF